MLDNLGLVHSIVRKFTKAHSSSHAYQELYSEGLVGLAEAAHRYDPEKAKFSTYAYIRVRGAILNYLQANKSIVRIPRGRNNKSNVSFMSLSSSKDDLETQQTDIYDEESGYALVDLPESIKARLTERECSVLVLKYSGYTQTEIGKKLGISTTKVNRIIARIKKVAQFISK